MSLHGPAGRKSLTEEQKEDVRYLVDDRRLEIEMVARRKGISQSYVRKILAEMRRKVA